MSGSSPHGARAGTPIDGLPTVSVAAPAAALDECSDPFAVLLERNLGSPPPVNTEVGAKNYSEKAQGHNPRILAVALRISWGFYQFIFVTH